MYDKFYIQLLYVLILVLNVTGCKSTSTDKPEIVELTKKEYQALIEMSEQWRKSKEGIQRLLSVEGDLRVLIGQLDVLVKEETYNTNQTIATNNQGEKRADSKTPRDNKRDSKPNLETAQVDSPPIVVAMRAKENIKLDKPESNSDTQTHSVQKVPPDKPSLKTNKPKAIYALQVAAVTEHDRVKRSLDAVVKKAPEAEKLAVNVEVKNIKQQQYYRLKLGVFSDKLAAQAQCDRLKLKKVNCIVSYYTDQSKSGLL
jgi:hypothetical protein